LRAKKVLAFIYDKLELGSSRARSGSIISANTKIGPAGARRASVVSGTGANTQTANGGGSVNGDHDIYPEDMIELLCGDFVIDPKITLATLKQYYGSGGDMVLNYRLKATAA